MGSETNRRTFLKASAAAGAIAGLAQFPAGVRAAGSDVLKVGLIGCGGRGSDAAFKTLQADPNVKLYAIGDAFKDHIDAKLPLFQKKFSDRVDVGDRQFVGFDAYKQVIDVCDLVLLTTPPHFRPMHARYAVEKGKHIFFEKPVAVDGPGIRSFIETAKMAKSKNICFASGFCYRYDLAKRETIKRIHDGMIGEVLAIHCNYNMGPIWNKTREKEWTDMEYQVRNWYYYTWLSGDHIVEQHVHNHDKAAWVMKGEMPVAASGMGGRQMRTDARYGNIFDHHAVIFEYEKGAKLFSFCRQMKDCFSDVSDHVIGSKGSSQLMEHTISGATKWAYPVSPPAPNMYQQEMEEIIASIRSGTPTNDGISAANSSMMAILGRMCTYSGQRITWKEAMDSELALGPKEYSWSTTPPAVVVAAPGNPKYKAF